MTKKLTSIGLILLLALLPLLTGCEEVTKLLEQTSPTTRGTMCEGFSPDRAIVHAVTGVGGAIASFVAQLNASTIQSAVALRRRARIQVYADHVVQAATMTGGGLPTIYLSTKLKAVADQAEEEWFIGHEVSHHLLTGGNGHETEAACDILSVSMLAAQGYPQPTATARRALALTGNHRSTETHPGTAQRLSLITAYGTQAANAARQGAPQPTQQQPAPAPQPAARPLPRPTAPPRNYYDGSDCAAQSLAYQRALMLEASRRRAMMKGFRRPPPQTYTPYWHERWQ